MYKVEMERQNNICQSIKPDNIESSPMIAEKRIKIEEKKLDNELENQLQSCCSGTISDRRFLIWISTFSISILVLVFSLTSLVLTHECSEQQIYVGLISIIVGYWLPTAH
jgi:hypothetical protein